MNKNKYVIISVIVAIMILFLAYVIVIIMPNPNISETETLYCGPNQSKPVKVFKNPTAAFPDFIKDYNLHVQTSLELLDSAIGINGKPSLDLTYKQNVVELREKLNQENARMQMILKSNFFAYNSNPCDSNISIKYFSLLQLVAEKILQLDKFRAGMTRPISQGSTHEGKITLTQDTSQISSAVKNLYENYFKD